MKECNICAREGCFSLANPSLHGWWFCNVKLEPVWIDFRYKKLFFSVFIVEGLVMMVGGVWSIRRHLRKKLIWQIGSKLGLGLIALCPCLK